MVDLLAPFLPFQGHVPYIFVTHAIKNSPVIISVMRTIANIPHDSPTILVSAMVESYQLFFIRKKFVVFLIYWEKNYPFCQCAFPSKSFLVYHLFFFPIKKEYINQTVSICYLNSIGKKTTFVVVCLYITVRKKKGVLSNYIIGF